MGPSRKVPTVNDDLLITRLAGHCVASAEQVSHHSSVTTSVGWRDLRDTPIGAKESCVDTVTDLPSPDRIPERTPIMAVRSLSSLIPPMPSPDAGGASPSRETWQWSNLWSAPHRLAFFAGMLVLMLSGLWWLLVQLDRTTGWLGMGYAMSPTLIHAAVMVLGFMPLFFAGFLFTAGPKWLGMDAPSARDVTAALGLQVAGWGLWLVGGHLGAPLAGGGACLAAIGLGRQYFIFGRLLTGSRVADRVHATVVAVGGGVGTACLGVIAASVWLDVPDLAMACVHVAIWGFVAITYVAVAHRMIPFFTSAALPMMQVWRPLWVLWLMLGVASIEVISVWVTFAGWGDTTPWRLVRGALELATGGVLLWLAWVWGLAQSLRIRLLAMLHLGFMWLGLALVMSGVAQWMAASGGSPALALGALHALTMGFLGSLLLAMVTRVSCGHSGRPLVADTLVWTLFWGLQLATVLRAAASIPGATSHWLLLVALMWLMVMLAWGGRLLKWYGLPRADGKPG